MSEDQLQPSDTLDDRGVDDVLDEGYSPPDREPGHLRHPHEVDEPETLAERLAEEEPDVSADPDEDDDATTFDGDGEDEVGDGRSGRLVAQDVLARRERDVDRRAGTCTLSYVVSHLDGDLVRSEFQKTCIERERKASLRAYGWTACPIKLWTSSRVIPVVMVFTWTPSMYTL